MAEFFRPRGTRASSVSDFGGSDTSDSPDPSQFEPPDLTGLQLTQPPAVLFSSQFGELGLAASIFRLLGTPTHDSWPVRKRGLGSCLGSDQLSWSSHFKSYSVWCMKADGSHRASRRCQMRARCRSTCSLRACYETPSSWTTAWAQAAQALPLSIVWKRSSASSRRQGAVLPRHCVFWNVSHRTRWQVFSNLYWKPLPRSIASRRYTVI